MGKLLPIPLHCYFSDEYKKVIPSLEWNLPPNGKDCNSGDRFTIAHGPSCYQDATTIFLAILGSETVEEATARSQWYVRPPNEGEIPGPVPNRWHESLDGFVSKVWEIPFVAQSENSGRVTNFNLWFAPKAATAIVSRVGNQATYTFRELRTKGLEHLRQLNREEQAILWNEAKESLTQGHWRTFSDRLWEIARIQWSYTKVWLTVSATLPGSTFTAICERGNADSGFPNDPKTSPAECRLHNMPLPAQWDSGSYNKPKPITFAYEGTYTFPQFKRYSGPSLLTQGIALGALALLVHYRKAIPIIIAQGIRSVKRLP